MNQFFLSGDERLKAWKEFRMESMQSNMSDFEHLSVIAEWWKCCPLVNITLDPYDYEKWPTAWELLNDGKFCRSAIGLAMEQTLLMRNGRWNNERVILALINDDVEGIYLAPIIDNKWILNYEIGEVTELADISINVIDTFKFQEGYHTIIPNPF